MRKTLRTRGSMILGATVVMAALGSILCCPSPAEAFHPPVFLPPPPPPPPPPPLITPPPPVVIPPPPDNPPPNNPPPNNPPPGTPPGGQQHSPEPATLVTGLIGSGLAGLFAVRRRRKLPASASTPAGSV